MEMTTVAVKVVKQNSDADAVKSLMSELETLIHLGSHMNIVSLLGACTDDIASGTLHKILTVKHLTLIEHPYGRKPYDRRRILPLREPPQLHKDPQRPFYQSALASG